MQKLLGFLNLHLIKSLVLSEVFISFYSLKELNITVTKDREGLENDIELLIDMLDAFNFSLAFAVAFYK